MSDFADISSTLRQSLVEYYRVAGETVTWAGWHNTLETNSGYVERRARPLIELYERTSGQQSLQGLHVIDVGCGFGAMSVWLAAQGATVHGVDPNARRLTVGREAAARHGLAVTMAPGRMERLDIPDQSFDLAVLNNSLCYLVDRAQRRSALQEVHRVLRPGGHVVLRNPNRLALRDQFTGLPLVHVLPPGAADRAARIVRRRRSRVRVLTPRGARRELRAAGFVDVASAVAPDTRLPAPLRRFASYQHLVAARPA